MWFVSGLVLIYHSFPNVDKSQLYEKKEALPSSLPAIQEIISRLPEDDQNIRSLQVRNFQDQTLFTLKTKENTYTFCIDTLHIPRSVTWETVQQVAHHWVDAPALRVDTLYERDIWIMYTRYIRELPIYKFYFDDDEKHQLYISSKTGEVQQFTTANERFWAWAGSIPHKFYFPFLRKNTDLWINVLTVSGVIGLIASLTGLFVGIYVLRQRYKQHQRLESPYRKQWYKWHHITGIFFGIFLATWAFSGAMSMQRIPQWVIKTHGEYRVTESQLRGKRLPLSAYKLDYRQIRDVYPDVKEVEWSWFRDVPVYNLIVGNHTLTIDASTSIIKELFLPESQVEKSIISVHGEDACFKMSLIDKYEEYYLARKDSLPLPAYKVEVENADKSLYYIDPKTGDFKYLNRSRKAKKWIFSGLHYLHIQWLWERPVLWTIVIWVLCTGGAIVSLTGSWLGLRYFRRKLGKIKNK